MERTMRPLPDGRSPEVLIEVRRLLRARINRTATIGDLLWLAKWEISDALDSLPPKPANGEDPFHAGCAAFRAYSLLFQIEDKLAEAAQMAREVQRS
jgi:hypothetical protein